MVSKSSNQHKGDSFEKLVFVKLYLVYHGTMRFFYTSNMLVKLLLILC